MTFGGLRASTHDVLAVRSPLTSLARLDRNLAKAEAMQASVRAKLQDPLFAGFFLPFAKAPPFKNGSYHVTKCGADKNRTICSDLYHDLVDTPLPGAVRVSPDRAYRKPGGMYYAMCDGDCDCGAVPCAEFVYDHRNGSMLTKWLIDEYVGGPFGTGSPHVDGVFLDE